jgi:predicted transglutaminase-like cysteine proteinase
MAGRSPVITSQPLRLMQHIALTLLLILLWCHAGQARGQLNADIIERRANAAKINQSVEHSYQVGQNRLTAIDLFTSAHGRQQNNFDVPPNQVLMQNIYAKWRDALTSIDSEGETLAACRASAETCSAAARRLLQIVELGRQRVGRARLGEINRAVNLTIKAASDWSLYGIDDLWTAPLATLEKGAGDCEDYAILKYLALREAGISSDDLQLLIVSYRRRGTFHAVLAVHFGEEWLLLDNLTMVMVNAVEAKQYQPLFALDRHGIGTLSAGALAPDPRHEG